MKILRCLIGAIIGAILATLISWGGLYLFGVFILHGKGSLFDENQQAANMFFVVWFVCVLVAALIGSRIGYTSLRK